MSYLRQIAVRSRDNLSRRATLVDWIVGGMSILLWGLLFDQLIRNNFWLLDIEHLSTNGPSQADLRGLLDAAHDVLIHGPLYGTRINSFAYPPIVAYLFVPFEWIGSSASRVLWTVGNVAAIATILTLLLHRYFAVSLSRAWKYSALGLAPGAVFVFYPIRDLLSAGQVGLFLLLAVLIDLLIIPYRFRGYLTGAAVAIKLIPVVFVWWLIVKRQGSAVVRAVASFSALTLFAWLLWPHVSAEFWLHILPSGKDIAIEASAGAGNHWYVGLGNPASQSLRGLLARPPFLLGGTYPWLPIALVVLIFTGWTVSRMISMGQELAAFTTLGIADVLISPIGWIHYWVVVLLLPFVVVLEWRRSRPLAVGSLCVIIVACSSQLTRGTLIAPQLSWFSDVTVFLFRNIYVVAGVAFLVVAAIQGSWQVRMAGKSTLSNRAIANQPDHHGTS